MLYQQQSPKQVKPENEHQQYLKQRCSDILNFKNTNNINELLSHLQKYVEDCGGFVTTHQLRNIFSKVKTHRIKTAQQIQLIRPQLAYIAARQGNDKAKAFVNFLQNIICEIKDDKQVEHFVAFFEAIVAYHKLYHGNKK
ncbi:MAG: type III-A CRISPR-associated protein Csm2 [Saprospiraceae bacterium]|nr:type III-A CRISPR-associated protein Csm2 [Saprospiraceae bacterium]MDW8483096.1 type III-A CRISPR-associated protein Csm2 [Saprospiraceae bacterium]